MRRIAIALTLLAGSLLSASSAHARALSAHGSDQVKPLNGAIAAARNAYPAETASHAKQVQSGSVKTAEQLHLPPSIFPSNFENILNTAVTPNQADIHGEGITNYDLGYIHYLFDADIGLHFSYRDAGMLFGWARASQKTLPDGSTFRAQYVASAYPSPEGARAAYNSLVGYYAATLAQFHGNQTSPCNVQGAEQCLEIKLPIVALPYVGVAFTVVLRVVQQSNAVFEGGYDVQSEDFDANKALGDQILGSMTAAFVTAVNGGSPNPGPGPGPGPGPAPSPTSTPPPTLPPPVTTPTPTPSVQFNLLRVWFEKGNAPGKPNDPAVKKVKVGGKVVLAATWHVDSGVPNEAVTVGFQITQGKKLILRSTGSGRLASDPTGNYGPVRLVLKAPKKAGAYKGTVTITIRGQTDQKSAKIQVVKH